MNLVHVFYLINGCLQSIPAFSINSPLASFIPTGYVMLMGMIYEGSADYKRHKADLKENTQQVSRVQFKDGKRVTVAVDSQDLRVGDIIKL